MLSDHEIESARARGHLVIEPFRAEAVNPNSYDVRLGRYVAYWRRQSAHRGAIDLSEVGLDLFAVRDLGDNGALMLEPGESVLGHTIEFIGTTEPDDGHAFCAEMRATSTAGRLGITACRCAGHGDTGYFNRWTMEIQNTGPNTISIPVGAVIAQIVFYRVSPPERSYRQRSGNYQGPGRLQEVMASWKPESMIPGLLKVPGR